MAFATYTLLVGFAKGVSDVEGSGKVDSGFTPDLLMDTIWKCLILQLVEILVIKFLVGLKQIYPPFLDVLSYTGYKYVCLCINLLFKLTVCQYFGSYLRLLSTAYVSVMLAIFIVKSFRSVVPKTVVVGPPGVYIQLACGALQFAVVFVLCLL